MATIVLTGGGTAGHCIPHLALLPYLKNDFSKIYYIGSEKGIEKDIVEKENIPYYHVPCVKLNRNSSIKNLSIPFTLFNGITKAGKLLDKLKPDVIFSKGGYVAVPTVIAGKKRGIPVVSHESDYSMGLANKITSKYCTKVLTAFSDTAKECKNGEYIGSPIRKTSFNISKKEALSYFGFSGNKPVLLVTGGSLGAKKINETLIEALSDLVKTYDIIHVCGKGNLNEEIKLKGYFQTEFISNMQNALAICSVCVSRAGANTLFELLSLNIPTLLIPLPKGVSRGDQVENATYFQKLGVVSVLPQNALTKNSLILNVNSTYNGKDTIKKNLSLHPVKDMSRQISRIIADCKK